MRQATILAICYALLAAAWQAVLWSDLPNVGMGGLAVLYMIWPTLFASAIGLWFVLRKVGKARTGVFVASCAAMISITTALHPQESALGVKAKFDAILSMQTEMRGSPREPQNGGSQLSRGCFGRVPGALTGPTFLV